MTTIDIQDLFVHPKRVSHRLTQAYQTATRAFMSDGSACTLAFGSYVEASDSDNPYETIEEMRMAAYSACVYGKPFEVSNVNHNESLLGDGGNWAFRVHHDACHILMNRGFDFPSEVEVARFQAMRLMRYSTVAALVAFAEVVAQGEYFVHWGEFPLLEGCQPAVDIFDPRFQVWYDGYQTSVDWDELVR